MNVGPDSVTSVFMKAMDGAIKHVIDEKGEYSLNEWGVGDQRLALFFKLCRGLQRSTLQEFIRNVVSEAIKRGKDGHPEQELQGYVDLFVLAFQTRDIDEGKGERQLFYWMILELHKYFPQTVRAVLPFIPAKYGSWKDIKLLHEILHTDMIEITGEFRDNPSKLEMEGLAEVMMTLFATQLTDDDKVREEIENLRLKIDDAKKRGADMELRDLKENMSNLQVGLCGKWAPREGKHFAELAKMMAIRIYRDKCDGFGNATFDEVEKALSEAKSTAASQSTLDELNAALKLSKQSCYKRYRQLCARLNKHINTSEVIMCDPEGQWDKLVPGAIPARCLKIHRQAFFNKDKKNETRSNRPDRIICAERFLRHMEEAIKNPTKKKVHGKNLMPHELVKIYMNGVEKSVDLTLEAQWVDIRERLRESGSLGKLVVMSDVSGSMAGTPMLVSIAMGILISELTHPAFRNRFLTFHEQPTWHILNEGDSLFQKTMSAKRASCGGTTNFKAALDLILDRCIDGNVPVSEVKEMTFVIFSDMQFDAADGCDRGFYGRKSGTKTSFATKFEKIAAAWKAVGYFDKETGHPILPKMVFWNLRGNTIDFPCDATTPNVSMVSGFSANGLKAFMAGEEMQKENPETPYEEMRKQLDNERYDTIRFLCQSIGEIISKSSGQAYVAPVRVEDDFVLVASGGGEKTVGGKRKVDTLK